MEHFYTKIQGWSDGIDLLYRKIVTSIPNDDFQFVDNKFQQISKHYHFVEVGTWKGRSAAFMAVEIYHSKKNITFDCVDTWEGSINESEHQDDPEVKSGNLYEHFISNMKPVEGFYNPIRLPSVEAAKLYQDASLDFVFLDADHSYESVKADIIAWLPKVKKGGIIAGHDYYTNPDNGVVQAVKELLTDYQTPPYCWAKVIN